MTEEEIEFFDRLAPEWDANEVRSTPERIRNILGLIPIPSGGSVLDLGTGTGVLLPYLSEIVGSSGHVTAVDLSEGMMKIAKSKYSCLPNVSFELIDFEEELIPGMYDVVMLYSVYPHLHMPEMTFEWLFKMNIRPGGIIAIAFPSDEKFINKIHHQRASDSDHLTPPAVLAEKIRSWGYAVDIAADTEDAYLLLVSN